MGSSQLVLQTAGLTSKVLAKMLAVGLHLLALSFGLALLEVVVATSYERLRVS